MTDAPRPAGVTPPVAVVFATVTFVALGIGGLGVASLVLDRDVIPVTGLGPIPGVIGLVVATALFAGILLWGLRAEPPGYLTAVPCALGAYVGELAGIVVGGLFSGADPARPGPSPSAGPGPCSRPLRCWRRCSECSSCACGPSARGGPGRTKTTTPPDRRRGRGCDARETR